MVMSTIICDTVSNWGGSIKTQDENQYSIPGKPSAICLKAIVAGFRGKVA